MACNLRHGFWSLSGLAALAACGGGGGGGGGGGNSPSSSPASSRVTFSDAVQATLSGSQDTGYLLNFGASFTWNGKTLGSRTAYAYEGSNLLGVDGMMAADASAAEAKSLVGNSYEGGGGNDFFYGSNSADRFNGRGGNDVLIGRGGNDTLQGGVGNDILWGGAGADTMRGGAGNDIIVIIGSDGSSFNYQSAALMIPHAMLASTALNTGNLNLMEILGLTVGYINGLGASEASGNPVIDGGGDTNDLIIYGNVDATASNFNLVNFGRGNIVINSSLEISARQLQALGSTPLSIIGRDSRSNMESQLVISGSGTVDFTLISDIEGTLMISVEGGVMLEVSGAELTMLAGMTVVFTSSGGGTVNFDRQISTGELDGLIDRTAPLAVTEMGDELDGNEKGGTAGSVSITSPGNFRVNDMLTAGLTDADTPLSNQIYQWLRDGNEITNATSISYRLTSDDANTAISVRVTYRDTYGFQTKTSDAMRTENTPGSASIDSPQGERRVGNVLMASVMDVDGTVGNIMYQWLRDGNVIGEPTTSASYTLTGDDANRMISVRVTYTDAFSSSQMATSTAVPTEDTEGSASIDSSQGNRVGSVLMASVMDVDGTVSNIMYQWLRNGNAIGEPTTTDSYTLADADANRMISVRVTYLDAFNSLRTVTSSAVEATNLFIDTSQGSNVGDMVMAGFVSNAPDNVMYQWYRGSDEIAGATSSSYYLVHGDVGEDITLRATYTEGSTITTTSFPIAAHRDTAATLSLSGSLIIGQTVTAAFVDPDNAREISYQWFFSLIADTSANGFSSLNLFNRFTKIDRATGDSYVLTGYEGFRLGVEVTYDDDFGNEKTIVYYSSIDRTVGRGSREGSISTGSPDGAYFTVNGMMATDSTEVKSGDVLKFFVQETGGIQIPDRNDGFSKPAGAHWYRNGKLILSSYREFAATDMANIFTTSYEYKARPDDVGQTISVRYRYRNNDNALTHDVYSGMAIMSLADTPGTLSIHQAGSSVGDMLFAILDEPDSPHSVSYQWHRNGSVIEGETGASYALVRNDAGTLITVRASYGDDFGLYERLESEAITVSSFGVGESSRGRTPGDLLDLAKIGDFTGDTPAEEAQVIQLESAPFIEHSELVKAVFESVSLLDTSRRTVIFQEFSDLVIDEIIQAFAEQPIYNDDDIIFTFANSANLPLDVLLQVFPNAIVLQSAGNSAADNPSPIASLGARLLYNKWADLGKVYFVGGYETGKPEQLAFTPANGEREASGSDEAGYAKDYFFTAPYSFGSIDVGEPAARTLSGTSFSVQQVAAKIEAAFNAFNQFFAEDISLVETVRILKGAARYYSSPHDDLGFGDIDLRKLLDSGALKTLAALRTQAGLDPNTGMPMDGGDLSEPRRSDFGFGRFDPSDNPDDEPDDSFGDDAGAPDFFPHYNPYDDFI